jgi:para-nitrobenzyl esterase
MVSANRDEAEQQATDLVARLGCTDIACLRNTTPEQLVATSGTGHDDYRPMVGGRLLVSPAKAFATGRFNRVPVLYSGNHDEETGQLAGMELAGLPPADRLQLPGGGTSHRRASQPARATCWNCRTCSGSAT